FYIYSKHCWSYLSLSKNRRSYTGVFLSLFIWYLTRLWKSMIIVGTQIYLLQLVP
ncbi:DNA-directed RNA polymerase subunit beta', partial [Phtheirospermum japonicum]